jgi:hypothetical protein
MLLKAVRKGYLKGCPNISKMLILKYLNPSPATAKGHMNCPCQGISSTTPKTIVPVHVEREISTPNIPLVPIVPIILPIIDLPYNNKAQRARAPNAILDDFNESITNVFCFGAFGDKKLGVVYNDLTSNFPFMLYNGSICFIIVYHYEANAMQATPITGLDGVCIYKAYKKTFFKLSGRGSNQIINCHG